MKKLEIIKKSEKEIEKIIKEIFISDVRWLNIKKRAGYAVTFIELYLRHKDYISLTEDEKELIEIAIYHEMKNNFDSKSTKNKVKEAVKRIFLSLQEYHVFNKMRTNKFKYFIDSRIEDIKYYIRKLVF
jgi:hypothetical protein